MTQQEAINLRISRRTYNKTLLTQLQSDELVGLINKLNKKLGLSIKLVVGDAKAFGKFSKSYGMFTGVQNYIAMVGKVNDKDAMEKIGIAGEEIVLSATIMGLGTCWVAATFDKNGCECEVLADESLICVIPIGECQDSQTLKEKFFRKLSHRSTKSIESMVTSDVPLPEWLMNGMVAVQKAPSALNAQPVKFDYQNGILSAFVEKTDGYQEIDLGIAKYHFSVASQAGEFELGNGAVFNLK